MSHDPSRRTLLHRVFLVGGAGLATQLPRPAAVQGAALTPQCHDGDAPTVRETEGPYFKPSSPERAELVERGSKARLVELGGRVLTRSCQPV